jgi:hypothetical protein
VRQRLLAHGTPRVFDIAQRRLLARAVGDLVFERPPVELRGRIGLRAVRVIEVERQRKDRRCGAVLANPSSSSGPKRVSKPSNDMIVAFLPLPVTG